MLVLGLCLAMQQQQTSLSYSDGAFIIRQGQQTLQVPLVAEVERFQYSHEREGGGGLTVSFDRGGLVFAYGGTTSRSRLPAITRTRKLFTPAQIEENNDQIEKGFRRAEVTALSGHELIGDDLYLLARWDDADGIPWLEAIVVVRLNQRPPQAELVGRLPGYSFARGVIEDRLFVLDGKLSALTQRASGWGIAQYDSRSGLVDFQELGRDAINVQVLPAQRQILSVSETVYGTLMVSLLGLNGKSESDIVETRGRIALIKENPLVLRIDSSQGAFLLHSMTGEQLVISPGSLARDTEFGLLVWGPARTPNTAALYAVNDFSELATWQRAR